MKKPEHMNDGANEPTPESGGEGMHELLCAYLLGEADADQAARVEAALEESEELRAQRAQLEQTLGLVREAFPGGEALSETAFADVLAKAGGPIEEVPAARPRFVLLRPTVMRAAAAVLVVVTGTWAWIQRGEEAGAELEVARLDEEERAQGRLVGIGYGGSDTEDLAELQALGYAGEVSSTDVESDVFADKAFDGNPARHAERKRKEDSRAAKEQVEAMKGLSYAGEDADQGARTRFSHLTKSITFDRQSSGQADKDALQAPGYASDSAPAPEVASESAASPSPTVAGRSMGQGRAGGGGSAAGLGKKSVDASKRPGGDLAALGYMGGTVTSGGSAATPQKSQPVIRQYSIPKVEPALADGESQSKPASDPRASLDEMEGHLAYLDGGQRLTGADNFYLGDGEAKKSLSPEARDEYVREWCQTIIHDCYPRPKDMPRDMYFRFWGDNAFELTQLDAQSTFSVDVDTASYALARRYLNGGNLPTKAQIRTEEFLNAFDPDIPAPKEGVFAIRTELAPSRFSNDRPRSMLRVGIRGREVAKSERKPVAVTFVVDTSGSMREDGRLELVKHAMRLLVGELNAKDTIAIVAYSNDAKIVLPPTSADQGGVIESAIYPLQPNGSTNAEAGLTLGYQLAQAGLKAGHNNRVVFLSDGVANTGQTDQNRIIDSVRQQVDAGIYLNTIGVGMDNHNDVFLEQLADKGDGICDYVDSPDAARRAIVERFTGAFETIASDVKVQVEFDPKQVHRYRLLGYENRAVADKDFRNDAVDAGEIGAGHQVVALYELELSDEATAQESPLATVHLRYKEPKAPGQDPLEVAVSEIDSKVFLASAKQSFAETSPGYRRSAVVAQFAEFLRRSTHTRGDTFEALLSETAELARELRTPEFDEFLGLVKKAYQLGPPRDTRDDAELTLDEFRRFQILRKEIEVLRKDVDDALLQELQERNDELEDQLRDLLLKRFEKKG